MNNKKLGTEFEREFCERLAKMGYWVHFITPDVTGSQPFDVIAVGNGEAYAYDCKTSATKWFRISRLEDNQILAFEKWLDCGNHMPHVVVKYNGHVYAVPYLALKLADGGKINLEDYDEVYRWE